MSTLIHIFDGGQKSGPYALDQINFMFFSGAISGDATYWNTERKAWLPVINLLDNVEKTQPKRSKINSSDVRESNQPRSVESSNNPNAIFIEHVGSGRIITNFPRSALFKASYKALEDYGVSITNAVEDIIITGRTGMSMSTMGQSISFELNYHPRGTLVKIESESGQLIDWGRGSRDKDAIANNLTSAMKSILRQSSPGS